MLAATSTLTGRAVPTNPTRPEFNPATRSLSTPRRGAVRAAGNAIAAGGATVDGATGPFGGSAAGTISLTGNGITAGDLSADGGNAPNVTPSVAAGAGGTISVSSSGGASLGSLTAQGGNAYNGGVP